jgi:hypothetical protein
MTKVGIWQTHLGLLQQKSPKAVGEIQTRVGEIPIFLGGDLSNLREFGSFYSVGRTRLRLATVRTILAGTVSTALLAIVYTVTRIKIINYSIV